MSIKCVAMIIKVSSHPIQLLGTLQSTISLSAFPRPMSFLPFLPFKSQNHRSLLSFPSPSLSISSLWPPPSQTNRKETHSRFITSSGDKYHHWNNHVVCVLYSCGWRQTFIGRKSIANYKYIVQWPPTTRNPMTLSIGNRLLRLSLTPQCLISHHPPPQKDTRRRHCSEWAFEWVASGDEKRMDGVEIPCQWVVTNPIPLAPWVCMCVCWLTQWVSIRLSRLLIRKHAPGGSQFTWRMNEWIEIARQMASSLPVDLTWQGNYTLLLGHHLTAIYPLREEQRKSREEDKRKLNPEAVAAKLNGKEISPAWWCSLGDLNKSIFEP